MNFITKNTEKKYFIPESTGLLLDGLRFFAAIIVLMHHAEDIWFPSPENLSNFLGKSAHSAVILFFALSGYVIGYTTSANNRGVYQYAQARLTRLCSVVLPAMVITALIESYLAFDHPEIHSAYSREPVWFRYIISGAFLNEIWFFSSAPTLNTPLWSLSFEFWYYAIFGCWLYKGTGRQFLVVPVIACIIAGPKILLMMPVWIIGYLAYRIPKPVVKLRWWCAMLFFILAICIIIIIPPFPFAPGTMPLIFASQFLSDWIIALFLGVAFWFLPLSSIHTMPSGNVRMFRKIADLTFAIYVLHKPILVFVHAVLGFRMYDHSQQWIFAGITLILCMLIGLILESMRPIWSEFFKWGMQKCKILIEYRYVLKNYLIKASGK